MELNEVTALADRCVRCGLCLPHCPTYRDARTEGEGPRGRIAIMAAVLRGDIRPSSAAQQHIDNCLGCGRCETVCPAQVQYQSLRDGYRARHHRGARRWLAGALAQPGRDRLRLAAARWLSRWPEALLPAAWLRAAARLIRSQPPATTPPAPAASASTPVSPDQFFQGCQSQALDSRAEAAARRLLAALPSPILAVQPGCCGALARHEGALEVAGRQRQLLSAQSSALVAMDSGCLADLRGSGRQAHEICRYLLDHWPADWEPRPLPRQVALHLPCTHQSGCGDAAAVSELLARIPQLQLTPLNGLGCCGAGGMNMLLQPAHAARFATTLLAELPEHVTTIVSTNIGCRAHLRSQNRTLDIRHPLELLLEALPALTTRAAP